MAEGCFKVRLIALLNFLPYKDVWCRDDCQPGFERYQGDGLDPGLKGIFGQYRAKVIQSSVPHIGQLRTHRFALLWQEIPLGIVCGKGRQTSRMVAALVLTAFPPSQQLGAEILTREPD